MTEITLEQLLEAGCHFGHKSERWHPAASAFIYTKKDGVHIIDLAKTKEGLEKGANFVREVAQNGGTILFVATKRQAKGVVKEAAEAAGASYFVERWIGGFMTNWDSIKKNIEKINRLSMEQLDGSWKKFPKHEQVKLGRYLNRLKGFYGGVLTLTNVPDVLFVVDVRKEQSAVAEAKRRGIPVVAIVDTNSDPRDIDYVIPANDDAVGSVQFISQVIAMAYKEGKEIAGKLAQKKEEAAVAVPGENTVGTEEKKKASGEPKEKKSPKPKRGRPKKTPSAS